MDPKDFWIGKRVTVPADGDREGTVVAVNCKNMVVCIRWDDGTHSTTDMVSTKILPTGCVVGDSKLEEIPGHKSNCWTCKYNSPDRRCEHPGPPSQRASIRRWIVANFDPDADMRMPPKTATGCPGWEAPQ